jgi:predicted peptidase
MRGDRIVGVLLGVLCLAGSARAASVSDFIDFSLVSGSTVLLPGRLHIPDNYDPNKSYPLITFFHGYGERGTNNTSQINSNINNLLAHTRDKAFLYAPQSANGQWSESGTTVRQVMSRTVTKIEEALTLYNIDPNRIYATGLSAGGDGTWDALAKFPDVFAAGVPIASGWIRGDSTGYPALLKDKPIWSYHAVNDPEIGVGQARTMLNYIIYANGHPKMTFPLNTPGHPYYNDGSPYYTDGSTYFEWDQMHYTEYASGGHGIWGRVYNEQAMYDWLFAQSMVPEPTGVAVGVLVFAGMVTTRRRRQS